MGHGWVQIEVSRSVQVRFMCFMSGSTYTRTTASREINPNSSWIGCILCIVATQILDPRDTPASSRTGEGTLAQNRTGQNK